MASPKCPRLVLATGNADKLREFRYLLEMVAIPLLSLADFPYVAAVVEDGATSADNARKKATTYARQLGEWVLSDDTALEVDALGGAPGVHSARFAGERATMEDNRRKLLAELANVPFDRRTAHFVCHLALADPAGTIITESQGTCHGRIRFEPAGSKGFGYDSLFEVADTGLTLAELSAAQTATHGHRGQAVRALMANWPFTCKSA